MPSRLEEQEASLGIDPDAPANRGSERSRRPARPVGVDDAALIEKAKHATGSGSKFAALWRGDTSLHGDDDSAADLALCNYLAFWTGCVGERMDRLFRLSGLMRDKWERKDYADRTIAKAIDDCTDTYTPSVSVPVIGPDEHRKPQSEGKRERVHVEREYRAPAGDGFITEYVEYAMMRTDAPPEAHELMAVGVLSALAGPRPRLMVANRVDGWSLVIWAQYVADTTVARKSTVLDLALEVVESFMSERAIIRWEGSPQGFIQRLATRDGETSVFARDEFSGLVAQMNKGGHMAGMEQMLIRAFDGGVIENIRTKKVRRGDDGKPEKVEDTDRVENPYLVLLTAATRTSLLDRYTIENVLSGFLPRFTFCTGRAVARPLKAMTSEINAAREAMLEHARGFFLKARTVGEIQIDPAVFDQAWAVEQQWGRESESSSYPDAAGPCLKRLSETILRVAALVALDRWDGVVDLWVSGPDYSAAYLIAEAWKATTLGIIEDLGSTKFMRDTDAVMASIRRKHGISQNEISRVHRRLRKKDLDEILQTLEEREQIERKQLVETGGRPKFVYWPSTAAAEEA